MTKAELEHRLEVVPAAEWNAMPGSGFPAIVAFGRTLGVNVKRFGCFRDELTYWIQGTRIVERPENRATREGELCPCGTVGPHDEARS